MKNQGNNPVDTDESQETAMPMTYIEYIEQHDKDYRDEYYLFCKSEALDPNSEESAMSFIEYREGAMDEAMEQ